jgi:hypothetical protein
MGNRGAIHDKNRHIVRIPTMVLTPPSIVNAFRAGYTPHMAIPA